MDIWIARVPLICFNVIKWYFSNRVWWQFSWFQCVLKKLIIDRSYHFTSLISRYEDDWRTIWPHRIEIWNNHWLYVIFSSSNYTWQHYHNKYRGWYKQVIRKFMTLDKAAHIGSIRICLTIWCPFYYIFNCTMAYLTFSFFTHSRSTLMNMYRSLHTLIWLSSDDIIAKLFR